MPTDEMQPIGDVVAKLVAGLVNGGGRPQGEESSSVRQSAALGSESVHGGTGMSDRLSCPRDGRTRRGREGAPMQAEFNGKRAEAEAPAKFQGGNVIVLREQAPRRIIRAEAPLIDMTTRSANARPVGFHRPG